MGNLLETIVVKDSACVFEANAMFAATTEEIAELTAALAVVRKWENKAYDAMHIDQYAGEVTEFAYIIDTGHVIVSVTTGSIG